MSSVIEALERAQLRRVPSFQAGDRLRVHFQVVEGTRKRTQVFEGDRVGKRARVRERRYTGPEEKVVAGLLHDPAAEAEAELEAVDAVGAVADETVAEASAAAAGGEADAASTGEQA